MALKFRSKQGDVRWRTRWNWVLFLAGLVPALIYGVALGNVLQGMPFRFGADMRIL